MNKGESAQIGQVRLSQAGSSIPEAARCFWISWLSASNFWRNSGGIRPSSSWKFERRLSLNQWSLQGSTEEERIIVVNCSRKLLQRVFPKELLPNSTSLHLHKTSDILYITYIIYINFIYITYIIYRCSMSKYLLNYTGKRPQTLWGVRKSMHQLQAREAMEQQQIRRNRSG